MSRTDKIEYTEAQRKAIDSRNTSLLVGAAAGSGKTMILSERVLSLLVKDSLPVDGDRFAAMTFTVAAAGELRKRIEDLLGDFIDEHPDDTKAKRQLQLLKRAHIGTIHSFCAAVLREFAHEADLPPDFSIGDELDLQEISADALDDTMEELYADPESGYAELVGLFGKSRGDSTSEDLILSMATFLDSIPDPDSWIRDVREGKRFDTVKLFLEFVIGRLRIYESILQRCRKIAERESLDTIIAVLDDDLDLAGSARRAAERGDYAGCREALGGQFTKWDSGKPEGARKEVADSLKSQRDDIKEKIRDLKDKWLVAAPEDLAEDQKRNLEVFETAVTACSIYTEKFNERKLRSKVLSFDDLERYTLQLLKNDTIRNEIENRYDAFFVDEFQDVSPVQSEIINLITKRRKTLFAVGDVKQSIYGFRKAEPEIFVEMAEQGKKPENMDLRYLTLTDNFRSSKTVLMSANSVFGALMTPELGGVVYEDEKLTYPETADDGEAPGIDVRVVAGPVGADADVAAAIIAEKIQKGCSPGDFCIMFRSSTHRREYEDALDRAGIPHTAPSVPNFFEASEVAVMMSLLRVIRNGSLDIDAAAVMLSPLFGFLPDDLVRLKQQGKRRHLMAAAAASDDPRMRAFSDRMRALRQKSFRMPVDEFIEYLYDETGAETLLAAGEYFRERRRNLRIFLGLACERAAAGDDLRRFIRICNKAADSGKTKFETKVPANDAVTITTIHGSKGLQWNYVLLVNAQADFNQSDGNAAVLFDEDAGFGARTKADRGGFPVSRASMSHRVIGEHKRIKNTSEEMRVLYVALTRAKKRNYVLGTSKNPDKLREKAELIADIPERAKLSRNHLEWVLAASMTPEGKLRNTCSFCDPAEAEVSGNGRAAETPDPETSRILAERCGFVYPYASLNKVPVKAAVTALAEKGEGTSLRLPDFTRKGRPSGAEVGTAMHAFMQFADYQRAAADPQAELARLLELGFFDERSASLVSAKKISAFFDSPLGRRILASDIRVRRAGR